MGKRDDPVIALRIDADEYALIEKAIAESGMGKTAWLRVILLAGCGHTELAAQIKRASRAAK